MIFAKKVHRRCCAGSKYAGYLNSVLISTSKSFQMLLMILEIPLVIYRGAFKTWQIAFCKKNITA